MADVKPTAAAAPRATATNGQEQKPPAPVVIEMSAAARELAVQVLLGDARFQQRLAGLVDGMGYQGAVQARVEIGALRLTIQPPTEPQEAT